MNKENKFCKLCGEYCFNKYKGSKYCKYCAEIAIWLAVKKANIRIYLKKNFPNKTITFRLIIDKIEDNNGS